MDKANLILDVVGGEYAVDANPDWLRQQLTKLIRLYESGKIKPMISERYSLEEGGKAISRLAERQAVGKVVVLMD